MNGASLVAASLRRYFGANPCGVFSHFLIVLRDRLVSLEISLIDLPSRKRMPRILPINAMVITSCLPASQRGKVGRSPWSIFSRHHPRGLVNIRPASTAIWRVKASKGVGP